MFDTSCENRYLTLKIILCSKIGAIRKEVFITLSQLSAEILLVIKDATELILKRSWLEEMRKNIDWEDITQ
jgi:hypothetical protein